tara:strand:- start:2076 stop:2645 length:570 start_codon:yes stop_codon:yes gene_type:complete
MTTLYNKTALKKIKKDDLIQMFLDQQAKLNNYTIGLNGVCDACKTLQAENKKLKEEIEELKTSLQTTTSYHTDRYELLEDENKKLKEWSLSPQMIEDTSAETIEEFEQDVRDAWEEIQELKEKYEGELLTQEEFTKELKSVKSDDEVIKDINGKKISVPTEEECQKMFGVSKEEFIMLAQNSDCDYSNR